MPDTPKYERTPPEVFAGEELKTFFGAIDSAYDRLVFTPLLKTGLREQEAAHLDWKEISFARKTIHIHSKLEVGFKIKDYEERSIPIPDDLIDLLKK